MPHHPLPGSLRATGASVSARCRARRRAGRPRGRAGSGEGKTGSRAQVPGPSALGCCSPPRGSPGSLRRRRDPAASTGPFGPENGPRELAGTLGSVPGPNAPRHCYAASGASPLTYVYRWGIVNPRDGFGYLARETRTCGYRFWCDPIPSLRSEKGKKIHDRLSTAHQAHQAAHRIW